MNLPTALDTFSLTTIEHDTSDAAMLEYLLHKLRTAILLSPQQSDTTQPFIHYFAGYQGCMHRVVLYKSPELFAQQALPFVGFISKKKTILAASVVDEIADIDKTLILEFMQNSELLSYSSLELEDGNWCNLVVFNSVSAKTHIEHSHTHQHAAYRMAPQYYDWIRLHNGVITRESMHDQLTIERTKYYTFHAGQTRPVIYEKMKRL